jgi:hypothetical protein
MKSENRQKTGRKVPRSAFKPGTSGNPGGRPKRTPEEKAEQLALEAACREKTKEALKTVEQLMHKADKDSVRLAAAQFMIERGWGKAVQPDVHGGSNGGPIEHRIVAEIVRGVAPRYR